MNKNRIIGLFDKYAVAYNQKYFDVEKYSKGFHFLNNNLGNKKYNLLDLACGPGNVSKYLSNMNDQLQITGIDMSPEMIRLAKQNVPHGNFIQLDVLDINQLKDSFDIITAGFILPYLSQKEVPDFFKNVKDKLTSNGYFYLSTMAGDPKLSGLEPSSTGEDEMYIQYHSRSFIEKNLMAKNLFIQYSNTIDIDSKKNIKDLIIIAKIKK